MGNDITESIEIIDFKVILENETVLLRPMMKEDLVEFIKLTNDKSMWIYFTSDLSENSELKDWVNTALLQKEKKTRLPFTIIDKASGQILGSTSFGNISYHDKRVEIGWTWLGKEFQGKGINSQIKKLMLGYCIDIHEFERVEFKTDVLNIPARKALLRIHITEEGILRSHTLMTNNRRRDTIYYSVTKSEWNDVKIKNKWDQNF